MYVFHKNHSPPFFFDCTNITFKIFTDPAAGASDDWFKGSNGAKYAYTFELPGGGSQGFNPPPSAIDPIVKELWAGLKVGFNVIIDEFGKKK